MTITCNSQKPAEADPHARRIRSPRRSQSGNHHVDRFAADPGLNAKPTARHERTQNRRHIRAQHSKRRAREHREGNSILRARMGVEEHRGENQYISQEATVNIACRQLIPPAIMPLTQAGTLEC